jgi:hypothetical protein
MDQHCRIYLHNGLNINDPNYFYMKMPGCIKIYFMLLLAMLARMDGLSQQAKLFSKYNYYTVEKEVVIMAELPKKLLAGPYKLSVFNKNNLIAETALLKDNFLVAKIALADFELGTTPLLCKLADKNTIIQTDTIDITRLQPKSNEVKIDLQTGGLIADGLPFFPFGFYCKPAGHLPEQEITHGFNLIAPYQSNLDDTYKERKANMDRCAQFGMKVQYSVNSLIGSGHNGAKGLDRSEEEKEAILRKEIIAFRDHPALLSWYINDEPDGQGRPPASLEKAYKLIHELDPYHPISEVFMLPSKFSLYRNTMDIAMTDPYPVPGPLDIVESFVKQMNADYSHQKSVWLVPQAFGGQEMWAREPTAKEIRLMTYLGLINGVKGIQYYTHAPGNLNPQSVSAWSACSDIAVEVSQMTAFLLSDEMPVPVSSSDTNVLTGSFMRDSNLLIIAVNKDNKPKPFSLQVNDPANKWVATSTALLWFENREVDLVNGKINDIIDAQGTRVYLIKGKITDDLSKYYTGNLTANPGFEKIMSPGLPIGSNTKKSFAEKTAQGASFFADPRQAVEGMFSLRLITPVDSSGDKIRLLPIVIKANNSYNISVWAKAKQQEKMPSFRINAEGPGKEKVFTLTTDWQQYSFLFNKDSSYSSAVVTLELLAAGTAWFDMIQVTPDPRIGYTISKDNVANVSIATNIAGAIIKYRIGNEKGTAFKNIYDRPLQISKTSTVQAGLFMDDKQVAAADLFIPVNKALNKPVTIQSGYAPQYAAAGAASITDGLMGSTAFKDNKWLGFSGRDVTVTIDMQQVTAIHTIAINFLDDPNSGIYLPPKVSVYVSGNNTDFKLAGTYTNKEAPRMGEPALKVFTIDNIKTKARYIRVVANAFGEIPEGYLFKGTMSWIFVDEIMVD